MWETVCQDKAEKEFKNKHILYNIGVITQNKKVVQTLSSPYLAISSTDPKLSECVFMVFKKWKIQLKV